MTTMKELLRRGAVYHPRVGKCETDKLCSVDGCIEKANWYKAAVGYFCDEHKEEYVRLRKKGDKYG